MFTTEFAAFRLHLIREAKTQGTMAGDLAPEGMAELQLAARDGNIDYIY